jgi:hypothetical protein
MTRRRLAAASPVLLAALLAVDCAAGAETAKAVAVVTEVSGPATATSQPGSLHRLSRLAAGDVVQTGRGAALKLAFASGLRYRLGEASSATLGSGDLTARTGAVAALPRVPAFPVVPRIVDDRGIDAGAIRIRGGEISGVFPHCTAVPAGEIRLSWEPLPHAGAYRVEVYDLHGEIAFHADGLAAPPAVVPAAALQPGQRYSFKVETVDQPGSQAAGRGRFTILPADTTDAWRELHATLEKEADAGAWTLLAELDHQLRLRGEERADLRAAQKLAPEDPDLAAALAEVERKLQPVPAP